MKKMIVLCLMFFVSSKIFSQADTVALHVMQTDYLKKSRKQKTAAIILLSGGGVLASAGILVALTELQYSIFTPHKSNEGAADVLFLSGSVCMAGSIPLFISASHNKHKALSISFINDFTPQLQNAMVINKLMPAISFIYKF